MEKNMASENETKAKIKEFLGRTISYEVGDTGETRQLPMLAAVGEILENVAFAASYIDVDSLTRNGQRRSADSLAVSGATEAINGLVRAYKGLVRIAAEGTPLEQQVGKPEKRDILAVKYLDLTINNPLMKFQLHADSFRDEGEEPKCGPLLAGTRSIEQAVFDAHREIIGEQRKSAVR